MNIKKHLTEMALEHYYYIEGLEDFEFDRFNNESAYFRAFTAQGWMEFEFTWLFDDEGDIELLPIRHYLLK